MDKFKYNWLFLIFFLTFFYIFSIFFIYSPKKLLAEGFYYTNNIDHLFTHCLIAYPEIAFAKDNKMSKHYAEDCITSKEFILILDQLYKKNYALININDCFDINENGVAIKRKIKMPIGKKPLIFSFDDVNYDQKKKSLGMIDKIILDKNGNLASYTKINNVIDIQYDNEFIPILENFIKIHPDFSINGAKGTINLTGYDGILGYRTSHTNIVNRKEEIIEAKKIVDKLKNLGWNFASHSYGHYHMKNISDIKFKKEIDLWQEEVASIVGNSRIYVYPYGEWEVVKDNKICTKHQMLIDAGFKLFCGVGMKTFYSYLPNTNNEVLFMDRKCVDGKTITSNNKNLQMFFNPLNIIDTKSRSLLNESIIIAKE